MSNIASVDLGFGWTKAKKGSVIWRQPSVIGVSKKLFEESKKKGDLIYDNKYFIGDLAVRQSDVRFSSTKDNKTETWITEILLKAALGCLDPQGNFYLVSGLPIDFYFNQKESFEEMLKNFNRNDSYQIEILKETTVNANPVIRQSKIVPQPFGSAMDYLLNTDGSFDKKDEAKKRILVVDIGFYTLDLLILDAMEIHKSSYSSSGLGVSAAYRILQNDLKDHVGKSPERHDMDYVVLKEEYEGYNIKPLILRAFGALASQIQNEIESLNMNFNRCIVTGGAAPYIVEYLDIPNKHVLADPQLGNVRGYEKIGCRLWHGNR